MFCTNLKHWKIGKLSSSGRCIENPRRGGGVGGFAGLDPTPTPSAFSNSKVWASFVFFRNKVWASVCANLVMGLMRQAAA